MTGVQDFSRPALSSQARARSRHRRQLISEPLASGGGVVLCGAVLSSGKFLLTLQTYDRVLFIWVYFFINLKCGIVASAVCVVFVLVAVSER